MANRLFPIAPLLTAGLLAMVWMSCTTSDNTVVSTTSLTPKNQPAMVVAPDAFTFAVDALNFSYSSSQPVSFSGDSLVSTLVVTAYGSGTGSIEAASDDGTHVYEVAALIGNKTVVSTVLFPIVPKSISITLTRYTGTISFVLAKKK